MAKTRDPKLIQSLDRGLEVLEILGNSDGLMGVTELADMLGVDKATAYRILFTLKSQGYVNQDEETRKYGLGLKAIKLGQKALRKLDLRTKAKPFLRELAQTTGETVLLVTLVNDKLVYIDKEESTALLTISAQIGREAVPHCTATGKAFVAYLPDEKIDSFLSNVGLRPHTARTIVTLPELKAHLQMVRRQGYALDDEEYHPGVRCIAAPVFNHMGNVVASIGISGPAKRLELDRIEEYKRIVVETASKLSQSLGYSGGTT
jgi:IclR family KDG regulon transcriptional repressor